MAFTPIQGSGFGSGAFKKATSWIPEWGASEAFGGKTASIGGDDSKGNLYDQIMYGFSFDAPSSSYNSTYKPPKNTSNDSGSVLGTNTSSGSGGSSSSSSGGSSSGGGGSNTIQGYSPDEYYDRLNGAYNETQSYLNKAENSARQDTQNQMRTTTDLFNAQIPTINNARDKAFNIIQDAQTKAEQGSNYAMNSARELGGQLTQRATNLFGSGALSGVGQAAQEIYGRELQRNTGNIRQNLINNIQTLNNQRKEVEMEAQSKIQNVQAQLQQSIANLQSQLSARLQDIDGMRGEIAGRKDELKLDLMREYRTRAQGLQNEARSFAQQVAIETGNASRYLDTLMGQYNEALNGASSNAMNTSRNVINDSLASSQNFSTGVNTGTYGDMSLTGVSGYAKPKEEEQLPL